MQVLDRLGRPITETMGVTLSYEEVFGHRPLVGLVAEMTTIIDPRDSNTGGTMMKINVQLEVVIPPTSPMAKMLIVQGAQVEVSRLTQ